MEYKVLDKQVEYRVIGEYPLEFGDWTRECMNGDALGWAHYLEPLVLDGYMPEPDLVAEHFSRKLHRHALDTRQLQNIIKERVALKYRNKRRLEEQIVELSEELFGARLRHDYRQQRFIERMMHEVRRQLREEDMKCWMDCLEFRRKLFESSTEYRDAKDKYRMFS